CPVTIHDHRYRLLIGPAPLRQFEQPVPLDFKSLVYTPVVFPPAQAMTSIGDALLKQPIVELLKIFDLWNRDQKVTPGKADQSFDSSSLLTVSWITEPSREGVMTAEGD